jgi:pimeloyl-ACP methyl ester carboxylesterase
MHRTMSAAFFIIILLALGTGLLSLTAWPSTADAAGPSTAMPATVDPSGNYLLYYHNYYVETKGTEGDCKYYDILKTFADNGFSVISEVRPKDTSVVEYAKKAAGDVQKLLDAGVPQERITVAGHSKGGVIVLRMASLLEKPKINYLVMAGCGIKGLEKSYPDVTRLKGNFLSLYASSDKIAGSCRSTFPRDSADFSAREIVLESAAGHQLFFKPVDLWVDPVVAWLKSAR